MTRTSRILTAGFILLLVVVRLEPGPASADPAIRPPSEVLEWNQIFIDTLIATSTANSSSPRLGAIVHAAMFDAHNGIERRYRPIVVNGWGPRDASRRAAVVAAAHTALVGLFGSQKGELDARAAASLEVLRDRCAKRPYRRHRRSCARQIERGIAWGTGVAQAVLAWRANDGSSGSYPAFTGGDAMGQWRPTPPAFGPMSAQNMAFTSTFVLTSATQFRPGPPRGLGTDTYATDVAAVRTLGRKTGSTRTDDETALAAFWEGNASVHWNQAANQMARDNHLSMSATVRLLAVLNIAMADTVITIWSAKRFYGAAPDAVTWRPVTSIPLADTDDNPATTPEPDWLPLVNTPSHPEYPAGHPSLNGVASTVLLFHFIDRRQTFTLTTAGLPDRTYDRIMKARMDGNNARVWGGMHYPSTVAISDAVGASIARYVDRHSMQLVRGWRPDRRAANDDL